MTNPPNEPTPETDAECKDLRQAVLQSQLSWPEAFDRMLDKARSLERRAIAAEKERDELREDFAWLHRNRLSASPEAIRAARKDHD